MWYLWYKSVVRWGVWSMHDTRRQIFEYTMSEGRHQAVKLTATNIHNITYCEFNTLRPEQDGYLGCLNLGIGYSNVKSPISFWIHTGCSYFGQISLYNAYHKSRMCMSLCVCYLYFALLNAQSEKNICKKEVTDICKLWYMYVVFVLQYQCWNLYEINI